MPRTFATNRAQNLTHTLANWTSVVIGLGSAAPGQNFAMIPPRFRQAFGSILPDFSRDFFRSTTLTFYPLDGRRALRRRDFFLTFPGPSRTRNRYLPTLRHIWFPQKSSF